MFLYHRPNWRDLWTCNGDAHEVAAQRKYGVWWGDKWHAPIKESAFTTTAATRAYSCRLLLLGGWTAAGRQDRCVVPSAPVSTAVCILWSSKNTLDCFDRRPIQNCALVETKATRLSIARTRHAHVHDVSHYCCCAVGLYT